ncbi:lipopolysaccharide core heptose(I) kinase RfaP [Pseudomonas sp. MYb185]|uniref:lipopolysaccharide core heptose(I) kinase RfaP n=1 Tax=Pseudomonas sp. MYb185 TaxID=1848729 RepID=UPI000CFD591C|nr:lipopolysaccharide core heptose(I) kinase RfaP [Pseudomonas sp. MYb185]PRB84060.1 lipopolysaccharide core heptose(I) kinase RfaP [Pseudomonas sp. MYb185]
MKLVLHEPFKSLWAGRDAFVEVEQLQGEVFRELEARRTLRTEVAGRGYFVKIHRGVGWSEIFKNWSTLKRPVLGADQEWEAIGALTRAGVPTMTAVAFGERGSSPAARHSFIITEELAPTISLEDFSRDWPSHPPPAALKHALIHRVADMTGRMHRAGVNHRDCYICHFLLHIDTPPRADNLRLSLIDLHRAQVRTEVPRRWRDKDLAGLYFSALNIGLSERDKLRFLKTYFQLPLRRILAEEAALLSMLERKAARLQTRFERKYAKDGSER